MYHFRDFLLCSEMRSHAVWYICTGLSTKYFAYIFRFFGYGDFGTYLANCNALHPRSNHPL